MKSGAALLGAVVLCALATPADAKRFTAWYFGVDGGASFAEDLEVVTYTVRPGPPGTASTLTSDSNGWAGFVTAGYGFANDWRFELEGGYRTSDIDTIITAGVETPFDGDSQEY